MPFSSLRPEAIAPDETNSTSMPALRKDATWSTIDDMRVTSSEPSGRVSTLLPILIVILIVSAVILLPYIFPFI